MAGAFSALFQPQRRGGTDMNCRFTPIDARIQSARTRHSVLGMWLGNGVRLALAQSPGEGSRDSS
jgi:hypothetical protein